MTAAPRHPAPPRAPAPAAFCLWTHIAVSRNLEGLPFPAAASPAQHIDADRAIAGALMGRLARRGACFADTSRPDTLTPLHEHWLRVAGPLLSHEPLVLSPVPLSDRGPLPVARALLPLEPPPSPLRPALYAAVNNRDHLRLGATGPGECLLPLWRRLSALDDSLSLALPYAFHPRWGYAVADLSTAGSGLVFLCRLHLPLTNLLGLHAKLAQSLARFGFALVPTLPGIIPPDTPAPPPGTPEDASRPPVSAGLHDLFPNTPDDCRRTAFRPEEEALRDFSAVVRALAAHEASLLARVRARAPHILHERVVRAAARAATATRLSAAEAFELLSDLRLARLLGYPGIPSPARFNDLVFRVPPPDAPDPDAARARRAALLRSVAPPLSDFPPPPAPPRPAARRRARRPTA